MLKMIIGQMHPYYQINPYITPRCLYHNISTQNYSLTMLISHLSELSMEHAQPCALAYPQ